MHSICQAAVGSRLEQNGKVEAEREGENKRKVEKQKLRIFMEIGGIEIKCLERERLEIEQLGCKL